MWQTCLYYIRFLSVAVSSCKQKSGYYIILFVSLPSCDNIWTNWKSLRVSSPPIYVLHINLPFFLLLIAPLCPYESQRPKDANAIKCRVTLFLYCYSSSDNIQFLLHFRLWNNSLEFTRKPHLGLGLTAISNGPWVSVCGIVFGNLQLLYGQCSVRNLINLGKLGKFAFLFEKCNIIGVCTRGK
jgi:hypothetical protein